MAHPPPGFSIYKLTMDEKTDVTPSPAPDPVAPTFENPLPKKPKCKHGFYGTCWKCNNASHPQVKNPTKKPPKPKKVLSKAKQAALAKAHAARKAKAQAVAGKVVTVQLQWRHYVNTVAYGPGLVTVERDVARMLEEMEQRFKDTEANFHGSKAGIVLMGPTGAVVKRVAPEVFAHEFNKAFQ